MFNRSDVDSLFGSSTGGVGGGGVPSGVVNPSKRVERYRPGQLPSYAPAPPPSRAFAAAPPPLQPPQYELPTPLVSAAALAPPPPPPPPPPAAPAPRVRVEATVVSTGGPGGGAGPPMPPGLPGLSGEEDAMARRARIRERMLARSDNSSSSSSNPAPSSSAPGEGAPGAGSGSGSSICGSGEALTALSLGGDSAVRLSGPLGVTQPPPDRRQEEEATSAPPQPPPQHQQPSFRPVFVPRAERGAVVKTAEEVEAEAAADEAAAAEVAATRVAASRLLLAEQLAREESEALAGSGEGEGEDPTTGRPDDTDRPEEAEAALAAWRVREVKRVVRDAEAAAALAREGKETARRRGLTDEERAREDALAEARGEGGGRRDDGPVGPVVRFHHRGAFFVDADTLAAAGEGDVRNRSTLEATDGEKSSLTYNRALLQSLPAAARVKAHLVGRRGQGRYTSLMDEDTTLRRR